MNSTQVFPELLQHPPIPKQLHGLNPRSLKGFTWWKKEREKAFKKYNFCCWACGRLPKRLEAHEVYEIEECELCFISVVALCHTCHLFIHSGVLRKLYNEKKISKEKAIAILNKGFSILRTHKLKPSRETTLTFCLIQDLSRLETSKLLKEAPPSSLRNRPFHRRI